MRPVSTFAVCTLALATVQVRAGALKMLPTQAEASRPVSSRSAPADALRGVNAFATGFEVSGGFAVGPIAGGNGADPEGPWSTSGNATPVISAAHPATGAQHLRHLDDPAVGPNTLRPAFSPVFPTFVGPSTVSFDFSISATGGADYDVLVQSPGIGNGLVTARVKFHFADFDDDLVAGDILVVGDDGMGGIEFVPTGAAYTPGAAYQHFRLEIDPAANNIDYYLDEVLIHSDIVINAGEANPGAVDQLVTIDDQFQQPGETGDFDNFRVVPEPVAGLLLAVGIGLCTRRQFSPAPRRR